jgi:glycosyltransferase involved in cell wall biosynthesis
MAGTAAPAGPPGPVRVVQLVASGTSGGAQEHVASLLRRLDRARHEVRVISLTDGSSVSRWRSLDVEVEVVHGAEADAAARVAQRLIEWETQVLHAHMFRAEVVGTRAALLVERQGRARPYVIGHVHSSRVRSEADRALLRALAPSMDRLVAVSRAIVAKLSQERPGGPPVELVYNGVDLDRYHHTAASPLPPGAFGLEPGARLVGCVARLEAEKGHRTLLDAWPLVLEQEPGARLLIIGEGSLRDELEARADGLRMLASGSSRRTVAFTGRRDDIPSLTAAFDVAVLPSYREAQGIALIEAMALARPVVATRVGGIPEVVQDGVTGLLVPPHDPRALAAAITRLLADGTLAERMGRAGHDLVARCFDVARMTSRLEELYAEGASAWAARAASLAAGPVAAGGSGTARGPHEADGRGGTASQARTAAQ